MSVGHSLHTGRPKCSYTFATYLHAISDLSDNNFARRIVEYALKKFKTSSFNAVYTRDVSQATRDAKQVRFFSSLRLFALWAFVFWTTPPVADSKGCGGGGRPLAAPIFKAGFSPYKKAYSSLCAFAMNDDGAYTPSSAPLHNFWIRPCNPCTNDVLCTLRMT